MRLSCAIILAALLASAPAAAQELWGAVSTGQTRPDTRTTIYPFNSYAIAWNYPSPESALQAALKRCRDKGYRNCGGKDELNRGAFFAFSTSPVTHGHDKYASTRCLTVVIAPSRSLSELKRVYLYWGEGIPDTITGDLRRRLLRAGPETYCNDW